MSDDTTMRPGLATDMKSRSTLPAEAVLRVRTQLPDNRIVHHVVYTSNPSEDQSDDIFKGDECKNLIVSGRNRACDEVDDILYQYSS